MKKNIAIVLASFVILIAVISFSMVRASQAQPAVFDPAVVDKLDKIIRAQNEIMGEISSIKQDIAIIKIRVTQIQ